VKVFRKTDHLGCWGLVFATVVRWRWLTFISARQARARSSPSNTDDAASVRVGEEVRMAGISWGKVTDLSLEPNQVLVKRGQRRCSSATSRK